MTGSSREQSVCVCVCVACGPRCVDKLSSALALATGRLRGVARDERMPTRLRPARVGRAPAPQASSNGLGLALAFKAPTLYADGHGVHL